MRAIVPHHSKHPYLETLTIKMPPPDVKFSIPALSDVPDEERHIKLTVPLDCIPQVSVLNVTTCGQVSFSPLQVPDNNSFSLRELQLRSCQNVDISGLQEAIRSLKGIGAWDTLGRVVIEDCDLLDYGETVGVVGTERFHYVT